MELEDFSLVLARFSELYHTQINEYYLQFHKYLLDLFSYKKINLNINIEDITNPEAIRQVSLMKKVIQIGLDTMGITKDNYNSHFYNLDRIISNKEYRFKTHNELIENRIFGEINKILFQVLIEYLFDIDQSKIENLIQFDILSNKFRKRMDNFKLSNNLPNRDPQIEAYIRDYYKFFNANKLCVILEQKDLDRKGIKSSQILTSSLDTKISNSNKLFDLERTIRNNLKALKKDITNSINQIQSVVSKSNTREALNKRELLKPTNSFLEIFGKFKPISPRVVNIFKINISNFIDSINKFSNSYSIENLFYYISISKMLALDIDYDGEIFKTILQRVFKDNLINKDSIKKTDITDLFYYMVIINHSDDFLLKKNMREEVIRNYISKYFLNFNPNNIYTNYFLLLITKMLENREIYPNYNLDVLKEKISEIKIHTIENFDAILDIYRILSIHKLIDPKLKHRANMKQIKINFENFIAQLNIDDLSPSEIAQILLSISLLDHEEKIEILIKSLIDNLISTYKVFQDDATDYQEYSWKNDLILYTIEQRILFWTLLACSQFYSLI